MSGFHALMQNENRKLLRRKLLWVLLILIAACSAAITISVSVAARADVGRKNVQTLRRKDDLVEKCREQLAGYEARGQIGETSDYYFCKVVCELEIGRYDWRVGAGLAQEYAHLAADGAEWADEAERFLQLLRENDYDAYMDRLIASKQADFERFTDPATAFEATAGLRYCKQHRIPPGDPLFQAAQEMDRAFVRFRQSGSDGAASERKEWPSDAYALAKYRLEHGIPVYLNDFFQRESLNDLDRTRVNDFWDTLRLSLFAVYAVELACVLLGAVLVADEFSRGTIRLLLVAPVARWKILLAKYLTLLVWVGILTAVLFVCNLTGALISWGPDDLWIPSLTVSGGAVRCVPLLFQLLGFYLLSLVGAAAAATFAFAFSVFFRNSLAAAGGAFALCYGGLAVNRVLRYFGADGGRFLLFANLRPMDLALGISFFPRQSVGVAVVVLLLHAAAFLFAAFRAFDRCEI